MTRAAIAARLLVATSPLFVAAALFHLMRAIVPVAGDASSTTRHLVFVGINLVGAIGVVRRPPWFVFAFVPWLLQQLYSHGLSAVHAWGRGETDYASIAVVIVMPITFVALWLARDERR